jgi:hypothetical protein
MKKNQHRTSWGDLVDQSQGGAETNAGFLFTLVVQAPVSRLAGPKNSVNISFSAAL